MNARLALVPFVLFDVWLSNYIFVHVIGQNQAFRQVGFEYYPPLRYTQAIAAVVALVPLLWLRCTFHKISDILLLHVYVFVFIPTAVYLTNGAPADFERQLSLHAMMILAMGSVELRRLLSPIRILSPPTTDALFSGALLALSAAAIAYMTLSGDISRDNIDLSTVYERRGDIIAEQSGTILIYVANWSSLALAPICLAYGYVRRHWLLIAAGMVMAVEGFAITSFRSHLFLPAFAFGVMLLFRYIGPKALCATMLLVSALLTLLPLVADRALDTGGLYSWMIHFRFIGNSGFLSAQYFSFFQFAEWGYYQDSFGRFFMRPVYNLPLAELVGASFSTDGNHANGNLWADGYGNLGIIGVLLSSFSLALVCWLLDSVTDGKSVPVGIVAAITLGFGVANTAVFAVLTSNGGLLIFLLLMAMPSSRAAPAKGIS